MKKLIGVSLQLPLLLLLCKSLNRAKQLHCLLRKKMLQLRGEFSCDKHRWDHKLYNGHHSLDTAVVTGLSVMSNISSAKYDNKGLFTLQRQSLSLVQSSGSVLLLTTRPTCRDVTAMGQKVFRSSSKFLEGTSSF